MIYVSKLYIEICDSNTEYNIEMCVIIVYTENPQICNYSNLVIDLWIVLAAKTYKPETKSPFFESDNHIMFLISLYTIDE